VKTWTEEKRAYTATELQELSTAAFDRAREDNAMHLWEAGDIVARAIEDFCENVLPAVGLSEITPAELSWSISSYPTRGEYVTLNEGVRLEITDARRFLNTVRRGMSVTLDYTWSLPRVKINTRSRLWTRSEITFGRFDGERRTTFALVEIEDDALIGLATPAREKLREDAGALGASLHDWMNALLAQIIEHVHKEMEYRESAEAFIEDAEANDWYFDESGHIVTPPADAEEV
jgi:hypothetical protein